MKKLSLTFLILLVSGCLPTNSRINNDLTIKPISLTIYTYDSLTADYGLLPKIESRFEQDYDVSLNIVSFPDTGAMINRLLAEQADPQADLVLGIDNMDVARFSDSDLFNNATPFDYGYVGFVYDTTQLSFPESISLEELVENPAYAKKIIIEQPGLSSPGTQLMLWSAAVFGDDVTEFWQALDTQVLTVAPDWNTAYYSMFLNGEAPIVLSYLTSPAYHIDQEQTDRYQAIPISDGYIKQTEYVAMVQREVPIVAAQDFIDYLQSDSVQNLIATTQWMFPVNPAATLPTAYEQIITPTEDQILTLPPHAISVNYDRWLTEWTAIFGQ